jgi:tRNA (adenine57-N1/adenine58-N1)-methyltransferase
MTAFTALREADGRTYIVPLETGAIKVRGIGRFDPMKVLEGTVDGDRVQIGQKVFTRIAAGLPELRRGMKRRAQIISPKDAGFLIAWMGIGAGLALHLANVLGEKGTLISVENRPEHAEVGRENMERARGALSQFPDWTLIEGDVAEVDAEDLDAIILDLPEIWPVIPQMAANLRNGGRLACYCPVSNQLEKAWEACEEVGLTVDWAGEMIERLWTKASRGGVRPGNTPMGHTAFLLIAEKR